MPIHNKKTFAVSFPSHKFTSWHGIKFAMWALAGSVDDAWRWGNRTEWVERIAIRVHQVSVGSLWLATKYFWIRLRWIPHKPTCSRNSRWTSGKQLFGWWSERVLSFNFINRILCVVREDYEQAIALLTGFWISIGANECRKVLTVVFSLVRDLDMPMLKSKQLLRCCVNIIWINWK